MKYLFILIAVTLMSCKSVEHVKPIKLELTSAEKAEVVKKYNQELESSGLKTTEGYKAEYTEKLKSLEISEAHSLVTKMNQADEERVEAEETHAELYRAQEAERLYAEEIERLKAPAIEPSTLNRDNVCEIYAADCRRAAEELSEALLSN